MYSVRNWIGVGAAALLAGALSFATTAGFAMPRYDGLWSVSIVTTKGDCIASYRYPMRIANGILVNGGDIAVDVAGRVGGDSSAGSPPKPAPARGGRRPARARGRRNGGRKTALPKKHVARIRQSRTGGGCLRTAPRPGYAPTLLTSVFSVPNPHPSAASSSSPSPSSSPARIFSAMSPAFWRMAVSIFPAMSGLFLRKVLAFSRPWPIRWLS